jgi:hypothetical protein
VISFGHNPAIGDQPGAATGQAKIVGDDPLDLTVVDRGSHGDSPYPYGGRYPCGSLVHDGVWYHGSYCLDQHRYNWDRLGPLVGFRVSTDYGRTWTESPHTPERPLFGRSGKHGWTVKLGAPHFVDFGQELEHSPDGKAYLVGHGATRPDANLSWISGDEVYLARVEPGIGTMNDPTAYEFFAGRDGGEAVWTDDYGAMVPLVEWPDNAGCVTVTYNDGLGKYLMWVTHGWPSEGTFDTYLLAADALTGPYRIVTYMPAFGTQAYFLNSPSKFWTDGGTTGYLLYSNNYVGDQGADPAGGTYSMTVQKFELATG